MMVLVSDTSVLIDLERGNFLEAIFSLSYKFAVPDVLYHQEIAGEWGRRLIQIGMRVEEVSPAGVAKALSYRSARPALKEKRWTLLTGDRNLREVAEEESVECHGVLRLLDRMEEQRVQDARPLHDGLKAISRHPRCRLPRREVSIRLERYQNAIERRGR